MLLFSRMQAHRALISSDDRCIDCYLLLFVKELFLTGNHFLLIYKLTFFCLFCQSFGGTSFGDLFFILKYFTQFDKIIINSGGVPMELARPPIPPKKKAVRARAWRKEGVGGRNSATPEPKSASRRINSVVSAVPQLAGHQSKTIFNSF